MMDGLPFIIRQKMAVMNYSNFLLIWKLIFTLKEMMAATVFI